MSEFKKLVEELVDRIEDTSLEFMDRYNACHELRDLTFVKLHEMVRDNSCPRWWVPSPSIKAHEGKESSKTVREE